MLEGGFILLHRSILRWEWYGDLNTARLFIHLLLTVNYEPQRWQGIAVERGQRVASMAKLADETGLTVKQVRTALEHLKRTGEVTHKATSKYGLFTVNHYDRYQPRGEPEGTRPGMENGIQGAGGGQAKGSKPDVMFIDYLGLMRGDAAGNKPLWQITGEITHALKESARRHGAAVVALVQLARAADRQKEPALSDLKGGSDIEADADGVIFMRPQKTGEFLSGDDAWPVEAVIAKNRHGGVGRLRFNWQPQYHNYVPTDNTRR